MQAIPSDMELHQAGEGGGRVNVMQGGWSTKKKLVVAGAVVAVLALALGLGLGLGLRKKDEALVRVDPRQQPTSECPNFEALGAQGSRVSIEGVLRVVGFMMMDGAPGLDRQVNQTFNFHLTVELLGKDEKILIVRQDRSMPDGLWRTQANSVVRVTGVRDFCSILAKDADIKLPDDRVITLIPTTTVVPTTIIVEPTITVSTLTRTDGTPQPSTLTIQPTTIITSTTRIITTTTIITTTGRPTTTTTGVPPRRRITFSPRRRIMRSRRPRRRDRVRRLRL